MTAAQAGCLPAAGIGQLAGYDSDGSPRNTRVGRTDTLSDGSLKDMSQIEETESDLETSAYTVDTVDLEALDVPLLDSSMMSDSSVSDQLYSDLAKFTRKHRIVLFFTIFSSIFTGSFFCYVERADSNNSRDLAQLLYFTRLFSDLAGRLLTFLPRPKCLQSIQGLYYLMLLRVLLLFVFFFYIEPIDIIPKNDLMITALVCFCAAQSGYTAVLAYEYVGRDTDDEFGRRHVGHNGDKAKAKAVRMLNYTFQLACFIACVANLFMAFVTHPTGPHVE